MRALTTVIFKNEKRRERATVDTISGKIFSVLSFFIVFGTLAGFMILASIYITKRLIEINQPYAFINIMLVGNFAILFFESIFQSLNTLYFSKDLKIILRMPINSTDIVHSKLLKMVTSEYQMELIMLAIPMIMYGIMLNVNFQFYLYIPIILLILPIIPICITSILVAVIMRITNYIKNKSKVMYITIILATILLNLLINLFGSGKTGLDLFNIQSLLQENSISTSLGERFRLISPIMEALSNYDNIRRNSKFRNIFHIKHNYVHSYFNYNFSNLLKRSYRSYN